MTQQDFVKKEVKAFYEAHQDDINLLSPFSDGLTKGLELAKGFLCWLDKSCWDRYEEGGDTWYNFQSMEVITTDELLTIFLTEKYGQ